MNDFPEVLGIGPARKKKCNKKSVSIMVPIEFLRVVQIKTVAQGYPNRNDFLRDIAREWRPSVEELKKKGLLRDE